MLRLEKLPTGAELVRPAEKDEQHMSRAEEAETSTCFKCWAKIGREPFFRVNDRPVHARCTRAL
jgi:hypothetical protein